MIFINSQPKSKAYYNWNSNYLKSKWNRLLGSILQALAQHPVSQSFVNHSFRKVPNLVWTWPSFGATTQEWTKWRYSHLSRRSKHQTTQVRWHRRSTSLRMSSTICLASERANSSDHRLVQDHLWVVSSGKEKNWRGQIKPPWIKVKLSWGKCIWRDLIRCPPVKQVSTLRKSLHQTEWIKSNRKSCGR